MSASHLSSRTSHLTFGTAGLALVTGLVSAPAHAYCPCYTASSNANDHDCGIEAVEGENPSPEQWNEIFALVAQGAAAWGDQGPSVPDIGQGCGKPNPLVSVPARFPCELLKGIAMQETGWRQFCAPDTPNDQDGKSSRTIISFDCGYGIGQVTSGMHKGEAPDFDRARVAAEPIYNMATGTRILAEKWKATNCVGDNQPTTIEHWYTATWAYNGLAYVNNPTNPNYDAFRGVWDPQQGGAAPYQEKVFGWIEHPNAGWYEAVAVAYPNPGEIGGGGSPGELSEPSCASPTDCGNQRAVHPTACDGAEPETTGEPGSTSDATGTTGAEPTTGSSTIGMTTTGVTTTGATTTGMTTTSDTGSEPEPTTSVPTEGSPSTGAGSSGTGGGGSNEPRDDGGCGCRQRPVPADMSLLLFMVPLLLRRRHARG